MCKKVHGQTAKGKLHKDLPKVNRPKLRDGQSAEEGVGENYGREGSPSFGRNTEVV